MTITPILRMFDVAVTRAFYLDFLGFTLEFEYRHARDLPLCMGVTLGDARLHLSQQHGDCCPGGHVRIARPDLAAVQRSLAAKSNPFARPGPLERKPWGTLELMLTDPVGNRLSCVAPDD